MQNEIERDLVAYDEDQPFEGLGVRGWLKLVFQTRARTLKQSDKVTDMLLQQNAVLAQEANALRKAMSPMAKITVAQNEALAAIDEQCEVVLSGMGDLKPALAAIREQAQRGLLAARAELDV